MRRDISSTQLLPLPAWENPRVHLLDDVWLLCILAVLIAIGIPSLTRDLNVQIGAASWGLLALGAIHLAFTGLGQPASAPGRWRGWALTLLDAAGVVTLAVIWTHVGGAQNPLFLTVFVLPVLGSIFISRWHPLLMAAVGIVAVGAAALSQSPELRAYATGLAGGSPWVAAVFSRQGPELEGSFAGFYAPTSYLVVLLEVYSVVLLACALAAKYIGTIFERLITGSLLAHSESEQAQELWSTLIERLPLPALLVEPHSLRILAYSDTALKFLASGESSIDGRKLFSVARFSFADLVQDMIAGAKGEPSLIAMHIDDELRLTQVSVLQVLHKRRRLALLTLEDVTQVFCLKAALDNSEFAALVVDAAGNIRTFNKRATELFGDLASGTNAAQLLSHTVAGLPWWESGLDGRRKMHIDVGSRIHEVTSTEIPVPGEEQRLYSVSLLPVALAAPLDRTAERAVPLRRPEKRLP
jgi:PAS domain-containing protein